MLACDLLAPLWNWVWHPWPTVRCLYFKKSNNKKKKSRLFPWDFCVFVATRICIEPRGKKPWWTITWSIMRAGAHNPLRLFTQTSFSEFHSCNFISSHPRKLKNGPCRIFQMWTHRGCCSEPLVYQQSNHRSLFQELKGYSAKWKRWIISITTKEKQHGSIKTLLTSIKKPKV